MASRGYVPNAYWWLQFQLLGGAGRLVPFAVIYTTLLAGAAVGMYYLFAGQMSLTSYCDAAIVVLTVVQILLIVPGGSNAVFRALSRDINTKMLESHRLTPSSNAAVIFGYVIGANLQILMLYALGTVAGVVLMRWGTVGVAGWLAGNMYMLMVAPMLWAITLMLGIGRAKPINPNAIMFTMIFLSFAILSIPGLGLLSGVYAGYAGVMLMTGNASIPPQYSAILALVCFAMTVIWFRAAMRKFRRPDLPAFGTIRAIILFLIWLIAAAGGLILLAEVPAIQRLGKFNIDSDHYYVPICATVNGLASLVIAILPLSAAAHGRCRLQRQLRGEKAPIFQRHTGVPMLCAVLLTAFSMPFAKKASVDLLVWTFVAVWASFVALEGLLIVRHSRNRRILGVLAAYIIVLWVIPPLVELWRAEMASATYRVSDELQLSVLFGMSPVGTIAKLLFPENLSFNVVPGVVFQVVAALIVGAMGRMSLKGLRTRYPKLA